MLLYVDVALSMSLWVWRFVHVIVFAGVSISLCVHVTEGQFGVDVSLCCMWI